MLEMAVKSAQPDLTNLDYLRRQRESQPVWPDDEADVWHVYRYADVPAILADHRTYSSDFLKAHPDQTDLAEGNIVAMDPPRHDQLRGLVSQAFTPRTIAQLEGR